MFKYERHSHDTRDKNNIYSYQVKHSFAKKCLRHSLPLLLNNIHKIVKDKFISNSTQGFAKYIKMYFLQNYQVAYGIQNCYVCMQN